MRLIAFNRLTALIKKHFNHEHFYKMYLGKPDVHKLPLGCGWQPGLQKPVLRHHPRRG